MDIQGQKKLLKENASLKNQLVEQAIELGLRKRKLEIEAALDKVRIRAGDMRSSSELAESSEVLFQQLNELGINAIWAAVCIFDDANEAMELWLTSYADSGEIIRMLYYFNLNIHPVFANVIPARQENKPYALTILTGNEVPSYYQTMSTYLSAPTQQVFNETEYFYSFFFSSGAINVVTNHSLAEEQYSTMLRVAQVFGLIYTRFLDLQKAETSAREAQIESALERVRARAQAMQQPEELKDVIKVFRQEMGILGEDELETCHIYIYDVEAYISECWFALKDLRTPEHKILSDQIILDLQDTWVGREMLQFFHSESKETSIVMTGDNQKEWMHYCEVRCKPLVGYYGEKIPDRSNHLSKFSNGAVSQSSASVISQESWDLLKRVGSVFSLAYSRFKDLTQARVNWQNLKEEKSRAENALAELKATQTQLIQSEKMASLGELTAGIAHEIQNPLNFVNNFSEVSKELMDEMTEELTNGDINEAMAIAADIKQNLEKINHHGQRASNIVKGMLQHSRLSSGEKVLTNINELADEYLRLSYHGLRAKDKSFNADFKSEFDKNLPKINVIPQEIGRVMLNLINNAFQSPLSPNGGTKKVIVSTRRLSEVEVEIRVHDNGSGIPSDILPKIFQPFFTTKPTGEGTGLGLSLAYDIITKGHGGTIEVVSQEGEGAEFIIRIPIS